MEHLRAEGHGGAYGGTLSPPAVQQALSALGVIAGIDGTDDGMIALLLLIEGARAEPKAKLWLVSRLGE